MKTIHIIFIERSILISIFFNISVTTNTIENENDHDVIKQHIVQQYSNTQRKGKNFKTLSSQNRIWWSSLSTRNIPSPESHASSFREGHRRRNVPLELPKKCTPATRGCNSQFRQYPPERRSCGLNPRSRTLFIARPFSPRQPLLCHAAQYPRASPLALSHFILTYPITYPVTRPGIDSPKSGSFPAGMLATSLSSPSFPYLVLRANSNSAFHIQG